MKLPAKNCRDYQVDISLLASGALSEEESAKAARHAAECPACGESLVDARRTVAALSRTRQERGNIEPSSAFHARWVEALQEAGPSHRGTALKPANHWRGFLSDLILPRPTAWGSLAALWMVILYFNLSCPISTTHAATAAPPTRSIATYLEQRRELARLLDPSSSQAAPASTPAPRPRTQRQISTIAG